MSSLAISTHSTKNNGKEWHSISVDKLPEVPKTSFVNDIKADLHNENIVYVLNAPALKSIDKGKIFKKMATPHGDNHELWIHPKNNQIMINSNEFKYCRFGACD
jgi:trans-2-enoyl-CoA reductase